MDVLLICGSVRTGSTNAAALVTAAAVAPDGITTIRYPGLHALPHFNPDLDRDPLPAPVAELRAAIAQADALLFSTPEYAGALPGALKNLLEWTVGGVETSDKPAGWLNVAPPGRGEAAHAELATVLRYTGARVVEGACVRVPATEAEAREVIIGALTALAEAASGGVESPL